MQATISRAAAGFMLTCGWAFPADRVSFNRDIRPIMSDTCFRCHGPDKSSRMAGMRLDLREEAVRPTPSKAIPIVPGKPEASAIIQRIFADNPARAMPPQYAHKELTPEQKDTIRRWVAEGAAYEGHWAYSPLRRPAVPEAGARHPIDAFLEWRLKREGLAPSPEADRRVLIRRVTLDLTGIPPTPAEVDAFLKDSSPGAYEKLVDRLLDSPRCAEKQTMLWLDAVRYADTCGFHGDNVFPAWPYRDYVLRAFRDNKPFDQFTREQLAGDLLPGAGLDAKIASAYNRLSRTSAEGGIQPKEYLAKYAADRVRTLSAVWLGATMGCAECHDHKFDPISSRDFYSMKAFFADIKETGLVPDRGEKAWGYQLPLPDPEQARRLEELRAALLEARAKQLAAAPTLAGREREILERFDAGTLSWRFERPAAVQAANGTKLTIYNDEPVESSFDYQGSLVSERKPGNGLVVASGPNPDNETYIVTLKPGAGVWTALGVEAVQDEGLPGARVSRGADRFVLTEVTAALDGKPVPFVLANSSLQFPVPEHPPLAAIDGNPKTGWGLATYNESRNPFLALRFAGKLETTASSVLTVRLEHASEYRRAVIGRFRLSLSAAEHSWPGRNVIGTRETAGKPDGLPDTLVRALRAPEEKRTEAQRKAISDYLLWAAPETQALAVEAARLEAQIDLLEAAIPRVVATAVMEPEPTRVLARGNFLDESGEIVEPAIPAFLGKLETGGRRATRLDLANWLVSPHNPLTARVQVNRWWRQFFGVGLSKALEDLGSQGEWPAHPELLDWLASEFIVPTWDAANAHAWDVKHLVRTIVTSHAYRQSSAPRPELESKDPDNRLLARQSRYRVEAETVRDIALAASGLLVEKFGGPSVRPYQPDGYLAALNFPKREYSASRGEDLYRRGLYTLWQRTFLNPTLATFDAPSREECTVNRTSSNTPLQALVLLNDPVFVEAARVFAEKALLEGGPTAERRIGWAFTRALGRAPDASERRALLDLHNKAAAQYRRNPPAAKDLARAGEAPPVPRLRPADVAAMTTVTRALLNLHETITRN